MKKYVTTMSFPQFSRNLDAMVPFIYAVQLISQEIDNTPYVDRTCSRLLHLHSLQLKRRRLYRSKYVTNHWIDFHENGQIYEVDATHVPYSPGYHELHSFCMELSGYSSEVPSYRSYFLEACREKVL